MLDLLAQPLPAVAEVVETATPVVVVVHVTELPSGLVIP